MRLWMGPVLLAACLMGACDGGGAGGGGGEKAAEGSSADIGEKVGEVNGVPIGSKEFEQAAMRKAPASGDTLSADEKKEVMDGLVEEKLLYAAALKKGLDRDPKVQKVMVNTLLREEVYSTVKNSDFTDDVLQKYYEEHKSDFIVPEKVQIKRILIKVTDQRPDAQAKEQAEQIRKEVSGKPDSFKDLAAKYSEDPYKRRGGDVGFVSKEGKPGLDQAVVDAAFKIETNAISDVFKTDEGYNIVQVAARREQVERTFQQMKGSVLRKVKNDKMKELYDSYVATLKNGAKIDIDQAKVDGISVKASRRPFAPGNSLGIPGAEGEEAEEGEGPPGMEEGGPPSPGGAEGGAPGMRPGGAPGLRPGGPGAEGGPAAGGKPEGKVPGAPEGKPEGKAPPAGQGGGKNR